MRDVLDRALDEARGAAGAYALTLGMEQNLDTREKRRRARELAGTAVHATETALRVALSMGCRRPWAPWIRGPCPECQGVRNLARRVPELAEGIRKGTRYGRRPEELRGLHDLALEAVFSAIDAAEPGNDHGREEYP